MSSLLKSDEKLLAQRPTRRKVYRRRPLTSRERRAYYGLPSFTSSESEEDKEPELQKCIASSELTKASHTVSPSALETFDQTKKNEDTASDEAFKELNVAPEKVTKKCNGPSKRPPNAYQLWYRENRDTIRDQSRIKNLSKAGRAVWKKVEDKSEWEERAKKEMERYQRELAEYKNNNPSGDAPAAATSGDENQ